MAFIANKPFPVVNYEIVNTQTNEVIETGSAPLDSIWAWQANWDTPNHLCRLA